MVMVSVLVVLLLLFSGCGKQTPVAQTGTLVFTANGEEFIRDGFTSKDGWELSFTHAYVSISELSAYMTNPAYDVEQGWEIEAVETVTLAGAYVVNLAGEDADPVILGEISAVPGHYNALSWTMTRAQSGPAAGYVLVLTGTATKDGETITFTLRFDEELIYQGGEYIGDERKGIVPSNGAAAVEATFHFDHLFGDGEEAEDDDINVGALGFDPFAALAENGVVEITSATLKEKNPQAYAMLQSIFLHLGHVGEGHCLTKFR